MQRRDFFKLSLAASAVALTTPASALTREPIDSQSVSKVAFPEKKTANNIL